MSAAAWMLAEIREQPDALERTLRRGVPVVEALRRRFTARRPKLVVIAARGTSDNAGVFGRYLIEIATGIPVSLAAPSIFTLYGAQADFKDALVVGISQSGESTDTNAFLADARKRGAMTLGITNESRSALAKIAGELLPVRAGKERSVAATKTYTGQMLSLYLLAYALGARLRLADLERIPGYVSRVLELETEIAALSERYRFMTRAVTVGRGLNYANALEFGLKLMETCYVVAERFSAADLLHGPIALIEASFPVFVFSPDGVTRPSTESLLERLGALNADVLVIGGSSRKQERVIAVPGGSRKAGDLFSPIPYIVPAQLLAAHLAVTKGLDPDRPRTLNKITRTM